MERKKCHVSIGSALLGQPNVRVVLYDERSGNQRATHVFFRRKKNDDGTWSAVSDPPWVVDLTAREMTDLSEAGYSVKEEATAEPVTPKKHATKKKEEV